MKIHKPQLFVLIVGFILLSYLLETIVKPLKIQLTSPYAFLNPSYFTKYPFSSIVIIIRAVCMMLIPPFLLSFVSGKYFIKVGIVFIIGALSQLLSIQQITSDSTLIPLEWAISLSIAGMLLILPIIIYILKGTYHTAKTKLHKKSFLDEQLELIK